MDINRKYTTHMRKLSRLSKQIKQLISDIENDEMKIANTECLALMCDPNWKNKLFEEGNNEPNPVHKI